MYTQPTILPLENGDRLTRQEFERRYQAMPHLKKAELIEGIVYMSSPVRASHAVPHGHIIGWLWGYALEVPGVQLADNATVRLDRDNEPQPDALLRWESSGRSQLGEDGYLEGSPELIVEIAASSASYDLAQKLQVYRRNEVQEYLVWQVYDRRLDWFRWHEGTYQPLAADDQGILRSQVFPGLWLAVNALLERDLRTVKEVLELGLAQESA